MNNHKVSQLLVPPIVSIVLPVFNGEKFVSSAVESILAQTFKKFELIIINDGSTDSTFSIINRFRVDCLQISLH